MKRARRIIFHTVAAFSLLLCAIVLVSWVRSHLFGEYASWGNRRFDIMVGAAPGDLWVNLETYPLLPAWYSARGSSYRRSPFDGKWENDVRATRMMEREPTYWKFGGIRYFSKEFSDLLNHPGHVMRYLIVRHWLLAAATAILPAAWVVQYSRRRTSSRVGFCPECDYDLRATPDRCPECGTQTAGGTQGVSS